MLYKCDTHVLCLPGCLMCRVRPQQTHNADLMLAHGLQH